MSNRPRRRVRSRFPLISRFLRWRDRRRDEGFRQMTEYEWQLLIIDQDYRERRAHAQNHL